MEKYQKLNSKKPWIWVIVAIFLLSGIGLTVYLLWPKKPAETKQTTKQNYSSAQQFQSQINQIKQKLNHLENKNQQKSLEIRLTNLENELNNLSPQNNQEIQQEIKEISEELGLNNQEALVSGQSLHTHTHKSKKLQFIIHPELMELKKSKRN